MKDNDKCVILKRKEYNELRAKADNNKPDYIDVALYYCRYDDVVRSNLLFSDKLSTQLTRMARALLAKVELRQAQIREDAFEEVAKMSRRERRKFLKRYE